MRTTTPDLHLHTGLADLAIANGGWLLTRRAIELGVPPATFHTLMSRWRWGNPHRGVHTLPGLTLPWREHLRVAVAVAGHPIAVTGLAALALHGLAQRHPPSVLQVVLPRDRAARGLRPPIVVHRSRKFPWAEVDDRSGMPAVPAPWALAHAARILTERELVASALALRQARPEALPQEGLEAVAAKLGPAPGAAAYRRLVARLGVDGSDSILEADARQLLVRAGLEPTAGPFPFRCWDGVVVHLDLAFPEDWVAVEVDGRLWHLDRFESDRRRWGAIEASGWRKYVVTSKRLQNEPSRIVEELRAMRELPAPKGPAPKADCGRTNCRVCAPSRPDRG